MYAPLALIEQTNRMIQVSNVSKKNVAAINDFVKKVALEMLATNKEQMFGDLVVAWCRECGSNVRGYYNNRDYFLGVMFRMMTFLKMDGISLEDFLFQCILYDLCENWAITKRVYKISAGLMDSICMMKKIGNVPAKAVLNMPSHCFYIDYNGHCPFNEDMVGCFVRFELSRKHYIWHLSNVIERKNIKLVCTDLLLKIDSDFDENEPVSLTQFPFDNDRDVLLDDGHRIRFNEKDFVKFFFNFMIYLYSANSDISYVERNRTGKRKESKSQSSTECYNVGFRKATTISKSKVRVKYVGDKCETTTVKRSYSSTWRSAHWHHFWTNDKENPGSKKLIVKWIPETFVRGNRQNDSVHIHEVTL